MNCEFCSGSIINSNFHRIATCNDKAKVSCSEQGEENWWHYLTAHAVYV